MADLVFSFHFGKLSQTMTYGWHLPFFSSGSFQSPPNMLNQANQLWLRASFEMRCLTRSFAGNIAAFDSRANQILSTVRSQDFDLLGIDDPIPRLMGLRQESCSWSVFMVLDHLRLHTDFLSNCTRAMSVGDELKAPIPLLQYWRPNDVGSEVVDQLQDSVWQYVGLANNLLESGKYRHSPIAPRHPNYGLLTTKRLAAYGCLHLSIHSWQIQKIIAQIGVV